MMEVLGIQLREDAKDKIMCGNVARLLKQ